MTAGIECCDVCVQFGSDKNLLEEVTLEIPEKSIVLLYGPTGRGKTTLFNLISGLSFDGFKKGKIQWGNIPIDNMRIANKLRSQYISLIYSRFFFIYGLSIRENVILPALLSQKSNQFIDERLALLTEIFSFDERDYSGELVGALNFLKDQISPNNIRKNRRNKSPVMNIKHISNGMTEIVNIARAFILDTPFIFADELLRSYSDEEMKVIWNRVLDPRLGIKKNKSLFMITRKDYFREEGREEIDIIYEIKDRRVVKIKG